MSDAILEANFVGIVGPTHNFAGLSHGNVASLANDSSPSSPLGAALEGLAKMKSVRDLGLVQAVLPPHQRPSLRALHRLGFFGPPEQALAEAQAKDPRLLRLVSSASAMWAANAATVAPASDTTDGRLHIVPANLRHMFHRSLEAQTSFSIFRAIFRDGSRFVVHPPLPGGEHFADEGAANHTRFVTETGAGVHLFAWGRVAFGPRDGGPLKFPARQTREASEAVARLLHLPEESTLYARQHPSGIDAGAFHTDVVAVGHERFLMAHELAFADREATARELEQRVPGLVSVWATETELPLADAVQSYVFNSQIVTTGRDPLTMTLVAPIETRENPRARAFVEKVVASAGPVSDVVYLDVRQSMKNGGGPACLRQRIPLAEDDVALLGGRVVLDDSLFDDLSAWVRRHYRDRLLPADLADPALWRESMTALDELTKILRLGSVYDFQEEW
ncbi:MAG TPA: N-succinylarginine dihydrolase [Polyangiaceae bacterium]|nr:N-succinylarginine dihydrolase [Polyangiaceae bacterium]